MAYQVSLTLKSKNGKTGPIPVSTTSAQSCPPICPFQGSGCYAELGHVAMEWRKVNSGAKGGDWDAFTAQIAELPEGQLWRHNQAGDLPGDGVQIDRAALGALVSANAGKRGFTYTHHDVITNVDNRAAVASANAAGFTINLSGNDMAHADELADLAIAPVVMVLPHTVEGRQTLRTPKGRAVVVCPATYRDDVTCASCGLCARQRGAIVGFPAHGVSKKKASAIAEGKRAPRFAMSVNGAALAA